MKITGTCHIRNKKIRLNNGLVFDHGAGTLDDFLDRAYEHLRIGYPRFYKMDRLSKLGFLAAEVLLTESDLTRYKPVEVNIVLSNASASLDTDRKYLESLKIVASPSLFVYTLPSIVAGEICIRHKIKGQSVFFVSSGFDEQLMDAYVSSIMEDKTGGTDVNACLAGWVEVLEEHHDVFLYLVENSNSGMEHSAGQLKHLYHQ